MAHTFTGGADGANPEAGLVEDKAGNVYGTTLAGEALMAPAALFMGAAWCSNVIDVQKGFSMRSRTTPRTVQ